MKILIADDDPVSRRLLEETLVKSGYQVIAARDGTAAWEALQGEEALELAILDWIMPGMDGVEICRQIRKQPQRPYLYILLLTSKGKREDFDEGMRAGADGYLIKPFNAEELKLRLLAGQHIIRLQQELGAAQEALRTQAVCDPFAGVWNRAGILDLLGRELARAERTTTSVGVILAELDPLESIDNASGGRVRDEVLIEVARRLRVSMRPYDGIGRYGEEVFLIVLPECNLADTAKLAERLRAAVSGAPIEIGGIKVSVTTSAGVATSSGRGQMNPDLLAKAAEKWLSRARQEGGNRVAVGE